MFRFGQVAGLLTLWIVGLAACRGTTMEQPDAAATPIRIAVTIPPQIWLVRQIEPDAEVICLTGPMDSPETFQPDDAAITRVMAADLYVTIGVPCESGPWFSALRTAAIPTVAVHDESHGHGHDHHHDHSHCDDPHHWLAPEWLAEQSSKIVAALDAHDPAGAPTRRQRAADFRAAMVALDEEIAETLRPYRGRPFFVVHPAWGHFADTYGLQQIGLELHGQPLDDVGMTAYHTAMRNAGATVVFAQPQSSLALAERAAAAVDGRVETLDPLVEDVAANLRRATVLLAESFEDAPP